MALRLPPKFVKYVFIPCGYYFLRLYLSLLRVKVIGEAEGWQAYYRHERAIVALWHQRILPTLAYVSKFRSFNACIMISQSRDGDLIAPIAERLGLKPVRGSSTRGGRAAMMEILRILRKNPAAVHIVDGPQGPKGVIKPGLIQMAQVINAAVFPLYVSAEKAWVMKSWDRFLVPKPFSRVTLRWGKPISVPRKLDSEAFETLRIDIEDKMIEGYAKEDLDCGWKKPL